VKIIGEEDKDDCKVEKNIKEEDVE